MGSSVPTRATVRGNVETNLCRRPYGDTKAEPLDPVDSEYEAKASDSDTPGDRASPFMEVHR